MELPVVLQVRVVRGSWQQTAALSPPCHPRQGERGLSHICPLLQLIPSSHHRGDHLQIQPHSLGLVVPGDRGAPAALGVQWAREGQLTPFLPGLLLVPFLPCCPAKGTRKKRGQMGQGGNSPCLEPASGRQRIPSRIPKPPLGTGHRCSPVSGAEGLCRTGHPVNGIRHPGCPHMALAPCVMCTMATRGSSKIINVIFFACTAGSNATAELSTEGGCSQAPLIFATGFGAAGSVLMPTATPSALSMSAALRNLNS